MGSTAFLAAAVVVFWRLFELRALHLMKKATTHINNIHNTPAWAHTKFSLFIINFCARLGVSHIVLGASLLAGFKHAATWLPFTAPTKATECPHDEHKANNKHNNNYKLASE